MRVNRMSPNLTSVPWAARHALMSLSGMDEVSKQLNSFRTGSSCFWRQLCRSTKIPRPTMPCSVKAVLMMK